MSRKLLARGQAVRIRCKACDWTERVAKNDAGPHMLYHRDVTCPEKMRGSFPTNRKGKMVARRAPRFQVARRPKPRCATCRDELLKINDALSCANGCTAEAVRM